MQHDVPGSGIGLYYAREVGRMNGVRIVYQEKASKTENMSIHSFRIVLPADIVTAMGTEV